MSDTIITGPVGDVRISGLMSAQASTPGDAVLFQLVRNPGGSETVVGPSPIVISDSTLGLAFCSITYQDSPGAGTHTYGIRATNDTNISHTVSVPNVNNASLSMFSSRWALTIKY